MSSCTGLRTLALVLGTQFSPDTTHAGFAKGLFASWKPQHSNAVLQFGAFYYSRFTRQRFADVLRTLGTIIEAGVKAPASAGDSKDEEHVQYCVKVFIFDWAGKKKWWEDRVASYFPTWSRLRRLSVILSTREYTLNPGSIGLE